MKQDLQLKVQAWLDGELPDHEARRIAEWVSRDAEAAALAAELGGIRQAMFRNEEAVALDDSRPFYWSRIQRQIQLEAGFRRADGLPWSARWRKFTAAMAGLTALTCVLVMAVQHAGSPTFDEICVTGEGMEAVTFHDQSAQLTVVWLQDNRPAPAEDQPAQNSFRFEDDSDKVIDVE